MSRILRTIRVTFTREGIEFAVTYAHDGQQPMPGTRKRTAAAAAVARKGLETALEALRISAAAGVPEPQRPQELGREVGVAKS